MSKIIPVLEKRREGCCWGGGMTVAWSLGCGPGWRSRGSWKSAQLPPRGMGTPMWEPRSLLNGWTKPEGQVPNLRFSQGGSWGQVQTSRQRDNLRATPAGQDQEADILVFLLFPISFSFHSVHDILLPWSWLLSKSLRFLVRDTFLVNISDQSEEQSSPWWIYH